ncbi:MAG: hypothetical protein ABI210_11115 [Abditibacteriaceae bacterium]
MKRIKYIICGISCLAIVVMLYYVTLRDDGAKASQQASAFIQSRPNASQLRGYLKKNKIDFDVTYRKFVPGQRAYIVENPDPKMAAFIDFDIYDVKKAWCGHNFDSYMVIYDRKGVFLESRQIRRNIGCLDF